MKFAMIGATTVLVVVARKSIRSTSRRFNTYKTLAAAGGGSNDACSYYFPFSPSHFAAKGVNRHQAGSHLLPIRWDDRTGWKCVTKSSSPRAKK